MGLVAAIFIIMAGAIYIGWQYHNEDTGMILFIAIFALFFCLSYYVARNLVPEWLFGLADDGHPFKAFIYGVLFYSAFFGFWIWFIFFYPDKALERDMKRSSKIWEEVMKLPEPSQKTLLRYRAKLGLPTLPKDDKVMNKAALDAWRNAQYNIRYKKKYRFRPFF